MPPPLIPASLLAITQFIILELPCTQNIPPPAPLPYHWPAELLLNMQFVIVGEEEEEQYTPPPSSLAELAEKIQLVIVGEECKQFTPPPPLLDELPLKIQLVIAGEQS
jgi:hypothetical protein